MRSGQDTDRVRADGVERDVAKRDLPIQSQQDVEADSDDRGQADGDDDESLVAVAARDKETHDRYENGGHTERARAHTFLNSARPNRPFGRNASARITSPKVTIWVYVEPSNAVISASPTP